MPVPSDFQTALAKNQRLKAAFDSLPPSHQHEYVEWITSAKRPETRTTRIEKALAMIAERAKSAGNSPRNTRKNAKKHR